MKLCECTVIVNSKKCSLRAKECKNWPLIWTWREIFLSLRHVVIYFRQPLNKVTNADEENSWCDPKKFLPWPESSTKSAFHSRSNVKCVSIFNRNHLSVFSLLCSVFSQFEMKNFVRLFHAFGSIISRIRKRTQYWHTIVVFQNNGIRVIWVRGLSTFFIECILWSSSNGSTVHISFQFRSFVHLPANPMYLKVE